MCQNTKIYANLMPIIVCFLLSFLFYFFLAIEVSPYYAYEGSDTSVFKLMGLALLEGRVPYRDLFDHKGPLLYIIEALGLWMNTGRIGIFFLQVIFSTVGSYFWYKTGRLFTTPMKSLLLVCLLYVSYYLVACGGVGNYTEDWSICFISIAFYYVMLMLMRNDHKHRNNLYSFIVGLCFACVFFIRPNDAVSCIGGPLLGLYVILCCKKRYIEILSSMGIIILACLLIFIPFLVYFGMHHAIKDFIYGLIVYNSHYAGGGLYLLKGCLSYEKYIYLPIIIITTYLSYHQDKQLFYFMIPTMVMAYLLLGDRCYAHYFIVWIPTIYLIFWICLLEHKSLSTKLIAITMFFSMPCFANRNIFQIPYHTYQKICRVHKEYNKDREYILRAQTLFDAIPHEELHNIWNYNLSFDGNNTFKILYGCKIVPCNRIPMVFLADVDTTLYQDMDIVKSTPRYILYSQINRLPFTYSLRDSIYIQENYYILSTLKDPDLIMYKRYD